MKRICFAALIVVSLFVLHLSGCSFSGGSGHSVPGAVCSVSGVVRDSGGTAVSDVIVRMYPADGPEYAAKRSLMQTFDLPLQTENMLKRDEAGYSVNTSSDGSFVFRNVFPGIYTVYTSRKELFTGIKRNVEADPSMGDTTCDLELALPGTVKGYVVCESMDENETSKTFKGINGIILYLYGTEFYTVTKNDDLGQPGYFEFKNIPASKYRIDILKGNGPLFWEFEDKKSLPFILNPSECYDFGYLHAVESQNENQDKSARNAFGSVLNNTGQDRYLWTAAILNNPGQMPEIYFDSVKNASYSMTLPSKGLYTIYVKGYNEEDAVARKGNVSLNTYSLSFDGPDFNITGGTLVYGMLYNYDQSRPSVKTIMFLNEETKAACSAKVGTEGGWNLRIATGTYKLIPINGGTLSPNSINISDNNSVELPLTFFSKENEDYLNNFKLKVTQLASDTAGISLSAHTPSVGTLVLTAVRRDISGKNENLLFGGASGTVELDFPCPVSGSWNIDFTGEYLYSSKLEKSMNVVSLLSNTKSITFYAVYKDIEGCIKGKKKSAYEDEFIYIFDPITVDENENNG